MRTPTPPHADGADVLKFCGVENRKESDRGSDYIDVREVRRVGERVKEHPEIETNRSKLSDSRSDA